MNNNMENMQMGNINMDMDNMQMSDMQMNMDNMNINMDSNIQMNEGQQNQSEQMNNV